MKESFEPKDESHIEIIFGMEEIPQRFVWFRKGTKDYVFSLPVNQCNYHPTMLNMALDKFNIIGDVDEKGGGFIVKDEDGKIKIYGKSTMLGDFNKEAVLNLMKNKFPDVGLQVE